MERAQEIEIRIMVIEELVTAKLISKKKAKKMAEAIRLTPKPFIELRNPLTP